RSLSLKQIIGDKFGLSYSLSNIAGIYFYQNKFDKALQNFERAYSISEEVRDSTGMATYLHNISYVFIAQKQYEKAIQYLQSSLDVALELNFTDLARANYQYLADIFEQAGLLDSALVYHKYYVHYKDSLDGLNVQKAIAELEVQF